MPMPNKKSLCKSKKFSVEEFCNSLISTNYYKQIKTTPIHECLRLVAFNYFNISIRQSKDKNIVKSMRGKCRKYLSRHASEIDFYFATHYKSPNLNPPTKLTPNKQLNTSEKLNTSFEQNVPLKKSGETSSYMEYNVEEYCRAMVDCKVFLRIFDGESAESCFRAVAVFFLGPLKNITKENKSKAIDHTTAFFEQNKAKIESYFKTNYGETQHSVEFPNKICGLLGTF